MAGSVLAYTFERHWHARDVNERLALVSNDVKNQLQDLVDVQIGATEATAAALSVDPYLDRAAFRRYASRLRAHYSTLLGVGYVRRVATADLAAFVDAARRDGAPGFPQPDAGARDELAVILYNEPAEQLRGSWGFDLRSEAPPSEAIDRAASSGGAALTARVVLAVDRSLAPDSQPAGFVIYAPVFEPGAQPTSPADRRASIVGWVNVPFRAQDLLDQVRVPPGIELALDDGSRGDLLAGQPAGDGAVPASRLAIEALDRTWWLEVRAMSGFAADVADRSVPAFALGLMLTTVLVGLVALLARGNRRWTDAAQTAGRSLTASEERLRSAQQREEADRALLSSIVATTDDAIVTAAADGTVTSWNAGAARLYGWSAPEVIGRPLARLLPVEPDGPVEVPATEGTGDRIHQRTARHHRADGEPIDVSVMVSPLPGVSGLPGGASYIIRDVSDEVRSQAALAAYAAELERSNRELEEFATIVSHDLSEPLRVVGGYVGLITHRYALGRPVDRALIDHLGAISAGVERLRQLIEGFLELSRLRADGSRLGPVALDDVVTTAMANLATAINDAGATIDVGPLPTVWGDRSQLVQLMQNLIGNAVRFHEPGHLPRVEIAAEPDPATDRWTIAVSDDGIGIPPEHQDRIFGMFRRLHPTDRFEGSGIGLAVCRRIVDLHGGVISVESLPGIGSTFRVTLNGTGAAGADQLLHHREVAHA
ncbi:MAG TPA: CHASE domain-containing protein [Acidimicrobiales bacterium]|nr:CHASE domain-containing protein [Acidimicrobiales bacterium]